jgi:hypothetical protein
VIGTVKEFNDGMNVGTGTLTEISLVAHSAANGTGTIAAVTNQSASTLAVDGTGEPYESVLVTLTNVEVTVAPDAMYSVGTMKQNGTSFKFDDDAFRITGATVGTCYASITGVWSYQVYDNAWYFLPTAQGTTGGTCPP